MTHANDPQESQPYMLEAPLLEDEDLEMDYEEWKKRKCCHRFTTENNDNLERHFWAFYIKTHRTTIRLVFTTYIL